jgi:hypothetical protein
LPSHGRLLQPAPDHCQDDVRSGRRRSWCPVHGAPALDAVPRDPPLRMARDEYDRDNLCNSMCAWCVYMIYVSAYMCVSICVHGSIVVRASERARVRASTRAHKTRARVRARESARRDPCARARERVGERASDALSSPQFFILAPSSRVNPSGSDLTSHAARACERGLRAGKTSPASTDAGLSMWGV